MYRENSSECYRSITVTNVGFIMPGKTGRCLVQTVVFVSFKNRTKSGQAIVCLFEEDL